MKYSKHYYGLFNSLCVLLNAQCDTDSSNKLSEKDFLKEIFEILLRYLER